MQGNSKETDKKFLDDYWKRYQTLLIESRNDESIIFLRDSIKNTQLANGRLLFLEMEQVHHYVVMRRLTLQSKQIYFQWHLMTII